MAQHILFDLDGTLADSVDGVTETMQYSLAQYGIVVEDHKSLLPFVGPPLHHLFVEHFGQPEALVEEYAQTYRRRYKEVGHKKSVLYPGIPEMLQSLQTAGNPCTWPPPNAWMRPTSCWISWASRPISPS